MKKLIILAGLLTLTACETVKGVGRDVRTTGGVITQGAQEVQNDL